MYNQCPKVRVSVFLPWHSEVIASEIEICRLEAEDSIAPLPRDRELPFAVLDHERACRMQEKRRWLCGVIGRDLATHITEAIMKAVESRDPQFGYSPEEWNRLNTP